MRVAIVSDIHGNRTAFETVLADLKQTSPDIVLHGGDLADAGSGSVEIVDQIRSLGWKGVAGNTDQMLASPETFEAFANRAPKLASLWDAVREMAAFTRERLGEERLSWLRSLPSVQVNEPIALVHASPGNPWVTPSAQDSDEQFDSVYSSLGQSIVVYGHIHQPFVRRIGSQTIANSGSVGQSHDGDRRASYLLVNGSQVEIRRIEYDLAREIQAVRSSGLPHADWIVRTIESASPQMPQRPADETVVTLPSALCEGLKYAGASWVFLDSAGAATCSAASLAVLCGQELPNPLDAVTELGVTTVSVKQPLPQYPQSLDAMADRFLQSPRDTGHLRAFRR